MFFGRLPQLNEMLVLALVAVGCALLASLFPKHDYGLMVVSMPLFFVSAVMGLRRHEQRTQLSRQPAPEADELSA